MQFDKEDKLFVSLTNKTRFMTIDAYNLWASTSSCIGVDFNYKSLKLGKNFVIKRIHDL
jgi:hypothetical protein